MKNIKMFRGKQGLTQNDLASAISVTRALVVKLEKDTCHSTSKSTTEDLCKVFGITPCKLYGLDNFRYLPETEEDCDYLISILMEIKDECKERNKRD